MFAGPALLAAAAPSPIPTVTLNNGVEMPMLALGTGTPGSGWKNSSLAETVTKLGLSVGFNHVDTAHNYFNQDGVGRALKTVARGSYFITTKVEPATNISGAYDFTTATLNEDAKLLGIGAVDLVLLHNPVRGIPLASCDAMQEQWRAMEDFYRKGRARAIGVSNFCAANLGCLTSRGGDGVVPMVNQVQFHIVMGPDPLGLRSYCEAHGTVLQAYEPLASDHGASSLITGNLTNGIGKAHNKSGAQVALRWLGQAGVPLITTSEKASHLLEDIDVYSGWQLTPDEVKTLDQATQPAGKACWS